uniref:Putative secreted protein n=1 Tax=Anopheles marajoara TaxID=58244 RepID=A0A2M4CAM7_9DIPT
MSLFLSLSLLDLSVSLTRTNSLPADSLSACYAVAIYWLLHCGLLHGDPARPTTPSFGEPDQTGRPIRAPPPDPTPPAPPSPRQPM